MPARANTVQLRETSVAPLTHLLAQQAALLATQSTRSARQAARLRAPRRPPPPKGRDTARACERRGTSVREARHVSKRCSLVPASTCWQPGTESGVSISDQCGAHLANMPTSPDRNGRTALKEVPGARKASSRAANSLTCAGRRTTTALAPSVPRATPAAVSDDPSLPQVRHHDL